MRPGNAVDVLVNWVAEYIAFIILLLIDKNIIYLFIYWHKLRIIWTTHFN